MTADTLLILRGALTLLAMFMAHLFARILVRAQRGSVPGSRAVIPGVRLTLAVTMLWYVRGIDTFVLAAYLLIAAAGAFGWWSEWRPRHEEDATKLIFPDQNP
jgi:hypothetical protein